MFSGQIIVRFGIALCLICMLIAPWFSDPGYDWVAHTTSELGGQGMPHSWIMGIGFLSYGTGILLSALPGDPDGPAKRVGKAGFGMAMIGTAIWSSAPITPGQNFDVTEDVWHSMFSGMAGVAFAFLCATDIVMQRPALRPLSWIGLIASVGLPLAMFQWPGIDGALQRLMFVISFFWFWRRGTPATAVD